MLAFPDHRRSRLLARVCALSLAMSLVATGLAAPAALAATFNEGGALGKLTESQEAEPETSTTSTTATTTKSAESNTSSTVLIVVGGTALALLSSVAFVIVRDARRVAPASDVEFATGGGSARHSETAMRKRRAKAKAARQQRKRNR